MSVDVFIKLIQTGKRSSAVPVTTGEIWTEWIDHPELASAVDFIAAHILPYWEGFDASRAVDHTIEFYDKLRQAADQSNYQPVSMISQTFGLFQTTITMFSMIFLLLQLAWWLAIIAVVVPIPSFISSTRYGWIGYQRMRRQSPERRIMAYLNNLMTTDTYNKEIKLFSLGNYFTTEFTRLTQKFYEENKVILIKR